MSNLPDDVVANATRAVCTRNIGGYCDCIGESFGCKVGRGEAPDMSRCKMTPEALPLSEEYILARAALEAARYGELVGEVREFLPRNVCLTNRNVPDATVIPLECTMGDLRRIDALLSSIGAAHETN